MNGELIVGGDPLPHRHVLPPIPEVVLTVGPTDLGMRRSEGLENAVARCSGCGRLFVTREDPDGWGRVVRWVPLRWWHRRAIRKLRVEEAGRIGGVAP